MEFMDDLSQQPAHCGQTTL